MREPPQGFKAAAGCLLILGAFAPAEARAFCTITEGSHQILSYSVPALSIPMDTANGAEVFSTTASNGSKVSFECNWPSDPIGVKSSRGYGTPVNNIMPFGNTGLGFSLDSAGRPDPIYPVYKNLGATTTTNNPYRLRIYKIGPLAKTVTIPAGDLAIYLAGTLGIPIYTATLSGPLVVSPGSCELATPDVAMGNYGASEFTRVGYTTKPIDFSIRLSNCSGAINKIKYSMTPGQGWFDPAKAVMKLDPGNATGLGIQILDRGRPVSPTGGAELAIPTISPKNYTFTASYYQTEKVIHAGNANSSMTVQITYL